MKPKLCFIDDSDFEHDHVRKEIAPCAPDLTFVQAYTYDEARDVLRARIPILFLLDLWGQDLEVTKPYLTPRAELEKRVSRFKTLGAVYDGLETFQGDRTNEYLKRLFTIVDGWRNLFEDVCARIGQNRKYGLANLRQVRKHYPGITAVFYTRKALINDAVDMFQAGSDGLIIKPTGREDHETRVLTRKFTPKLIKELALIIDRNMDQLKKMEHFYDMQLPEIGTGLGALIKTWQTFKNN